MGIIYELAKAAENLDSKGLVSEMLTPCFMKRYTNFSSFDSFLKNGQFKFESPGQFQSICNGKAFKSYIAGTTKFSSWEEMKRKASAEYIHGKLTA